MLVCQDRNCGFRQSEKESRGEWFEKSKKQRFLNKKLIDKYSDQSSDTVTFGDLMNRPWKRRKKKKSSGNDRLSGLFPGQESGFVIVERSSAPHGALCL